MNSFRYPPQGPRQDNPYLGGKRRPRAYPESQIRSLQNSSPDRNKKAQSYTPHNASKTTDPELGNQMPGLSELQPFCNIPQPAPMLTEFQSDRMGGKFSLTPGLRIAAQQRFAVSREVLPTVFKSAWATETTPQRGTAAPNSSDDQALVEAMQGLKIFGGLRPAPQPHQPQLPVVRDKANDPKTLRTAPTDTEAAKSAGSQSGPASTNAVRQQRKSTQDTLDQPKHTYGDALVDPVIETISNSDSETEPRSEESFKDISFDSPEPSSPALSVESSSSDDDFEVVDMSKYQTQRNGRPLIRKRWV